GSGYAAGIRHRHVDLRFLRLHVQLAGNHASCAPCGAVYILLRLRDDPLVRSCLRTAVEISRNQEMPATRLADLFRPCSAVSRAGCGWPACHELEAAELARQQTRYQAGLREG